MNYEGLSKNMFYKTKSKLLSSPLVELIDIIEMLTNPFVGVSPH